jgi:hypothetical protein
VGLGGDSHRHGGELHQLGVRQLLPAEDDDRRGAGQHRREQLLELPADSEQADDDQRGAVDQRGDAGVVEPGRVAQPPVHPARAGREQVRVAGREQDERLRRDHRMHDAVTVRQAGPAPEL